MIETEKSILKSPLRYPGGKAFLVPYFERFLSKNSLTPQIFVEPFAGGASLALALLSKGLVEKIALYDKDPLVAGFWKAVFYNHEWLQDKIDHAEITLEKWESIRSNRSEGYLEDAWKCLFLNRTSFSGILTRQAGPIGGKAQSSQYKIDCRFYRDTLKRRLHDLWLVREHVLAVGEADWENIVRHYEDQVLHNHKDEYLLYLDPPFFHKAEKLYNHYFSYQEHEKLIKSLTTLNIPWLLSYDHCSEVVELFRRHNLRFKEIQVRYTSSTQKSRNFKFELVASNQHLPEE